MNATLVRILGPSQNRLLAVTGENDSRAGTVSEDVARQLLAKGWKEYQGPAEAEHGWVVPDTDPNLRPQQLFRRTADKAVTGE